MQWRLFFEALEPDAKRLYGLLAAAFELDGYTIAISETDESAGLHSVELYVNDADLDHARAGMCATLARAGAAVAIETEALPDIDWVAKSLEGLKPVRAGRFLVHGAHDRDQVHANDLSIEIEAAQAFGTGHHGTTAGCLEMIADVVRRERPRNVLDLGTGSGVLAIAVAKLAHVPVLATDIDPIATAVAARNARLNGAGANIEAVTATGFRHREIAGRAPYDLIIANILARPLMRLAPDMARHLRPGGSLILSGILARQRNAVIAAYAGQRFRHVRTLTRGEWVSLHLKR
ncbi:50S ribosomal protein L11 methyltransferase [Nitratireductor sp. CAU 1489]|uniref:Ribosomal protein L11 methyltransferase n=1 Tax=Nitratireductor arenosus TaxID=2682096 RepID=A0A844QHD9_9HYPH|nr:50S ribosomal protein L11 methyltransferase [Nitratireductor arenosus]MVA97159.1 50S ribosomal protein L11 methyltransferase [Nitratireductor arenosus]